jgi:glycosyltransferase involved in cell wall biosynthesis
VTKTRLIVVGPLPPPIHGVTVSTKLVLANRQLHERFRVQHLDTSDHRSGKNIGVWDARNVIGALGAVTRLLCSLRPPRGVVYLPLSQSTPGFMRDSLFVVIGHTLRWRVGAHLRGSDFRAYYETSPRPLKRWIRFTLRRIDSVAVMGESLRWIFVGLVPDERIAVVPNGTPDPGPLPNRRDRNHVLFLSNLLRRKGVVEAVDAALLVLERLPAAKFIFAGNWESDDLERELRERVRVLNGAVTFQSSVDGDEKDRLLASAAVLLFPPVEPEGHPRVVLEALAAGVPVVTTNRGAIRETVGESGFVLDEPQPAALARCVLQLLGDPELSVRQSRAARTRYLTRYTQERADGTFCDWLVRVVEAP